MSTATVVTVVTVPGYPPTLVQAWCRRCAWTGPHHDTRTVFAGLDASAQRSRALAEDDAAGHQCDPAVLRLATVIRAQPGDPLIGGLEDVIRAVLAAQAATEATAGPAGLATDAAPAHRDAAPLQRRTVSP